MLTSISRETCNIYTVLMVKYNASAPFILECTAETLYGRSVGGDYRVHSRLLLIDGLFI